MTPSRGSIAIGITFGQERTRQYSSSEARRPPGHTLAPLGPLCRPVVAHAASSPRALYPSLIIPKRPRVIGLPDFGPRQSSSRSNDDGATTRQRTAECAAARPARRSTSSSVVVTHLAARRQHCPCLPAARPQRALCLPSDGQRDGISGSPSGTLVRNSNFPNLGVFSL